MTTYTVSKFDARRATKNRSGWLVMAYSVPARVAIQHIRELEGMGYDRGASIFVQRDDWKPAPSKPKRRKVEPAMPLFKAEA